jgi:hypothetical protein
MPAPSYLARLAVLVLALLPSFASASNLPPTHPTAALVKKYFEYVVDQDWRSAAEMILPESIERKRRDTLERLKRAPTMSDEAAVLEQLGVKDIREIENMSAVDFFVADRKYFHNPASTTPEIIKQKKASLKVDVLGVVGEANDTIAHLVVRTSQEVVDQRIIELVFISFVQDEKDKTKWLISPDMQRPTTISLKGDDKAAPPAADAAAKTNEKK